MDKKSNTPKQKRSIESKNNIIKAGFKLFSEKGFYKTNSKEIAREAGVSIGSFYMYFNDKKDLFKEVLVDYHLKIKGVLQSIDVQTFLRSGDGKKFLRYIIDKLIEAHDIYPEFHRELNVMAQSDPEINKIHEEFRRISIVLTKSMILLWKDKIRIKDYDTAAIVIQKTIEETVHALMYSDLKKSGKRITDELTDMLFCYMFAE